MARKWREPDYEDAIVELNYQFDGLDYELDTNIEDEDLDKYFKTPIPAELYEFINFDDLAEDKYFNEFLKEELKDVAREKFEEDSEEETQDLITFLNDQLSDKYLNLAELRAFIENNKKDYPLANIDEVEEAVRHHIDTNTTLPF